MKIIRILNKGEINMKQATLLKHQAKFDKELKKNAQKNRERIKRISSYIGINKSIKFKCMLCGKTFKATPYSILHRTFMCPYISKKNLTHYNSSAQKGKTDKFKLRLRIKEHGTGENIKLLSQYEKWDKPVTLKCLKCGKTFKKTPNSIRIGTRICPHAQLLLRRKRHQKNLANFQNKLQNKEKRLGEHIKVLSNLSKPGTTPTSKTTFKCMKCGIKFTTTPKEILNASHLCPRCHKNYINNVLVTRKSTKRSWTNKRWLQEKFHKRLIQKEQSTGDKVKQLEVYKGSYTPIRFKCLKCGKIFKARPNNLLYDKTLCPNRHKSRLPKYRTEQFHKHLIKREKETGDHLKQLSPYNGFHTSITFKCLKCGRVFKATPNRLAEDKFLCPYHNYTNCKYNNNNDLSLKDRARTFHKHLIKKEHETKDHVQQLNSYKNFYTPIKFKCLKCGKTFKVTPAQLRCRIFMCPQCHKKQKQYKKLKHHTFLQLSHKSRAKKPKVKEFRKKLLQKEHKIGGHIKQLTPYKNSNTPTKFKCFRCGRVFKEEPNNILKNNPLCPYCYKNKLKKYEVKRFHKCLVEKEDQTGDHVKQLSPYIDRKTDIKFKCLRCRKVFKLAPVTLLNEPNKRFICSRCYRAKKFHQRLIKKEQETGDHVKQLTPYKYFGTPIKFKCSKCGKIFKTTPSCLKYRTFICPQCHKKQSEEQKTQWFHKRLIKKENINGDRVKQLSPYIEWSIPIKFQCLKCGKVFKATPSTLHADKFLCPNCHKTRYHNRPLKDRAKVFHKQLIKKKHQTGEHVKQLTPYTGKGNYIKFKCLKCGRIFKIHPCSLSTYNHLCPKDRISTGESYCSKWLNEHGLKGNYHYSYICSNHPYTKGYLHLDFYLPNLKTNKYTNGIAIEFDGQQHFQPIDFSGEAPKWKKQLNLGLIQYRDKAKNAYCIKNHIKLIRIENKKNYQGKKLKHLVNSTLNKKLLPLLKKITKQANNKKNNWKKRYKELLKRANQNLKKINTQTKKSKKQSSKDIYQLTNKVNSLSSTLKSQAIKITQLRKQNAKYQEQLTQQAKETKEPKARKHNWLWKAFHSHPLR